MRGAANHAVPLNTQPMPADNTSAYVDAQVARWHSTGVVVHVEVAREIAAWYQAPAGVGYAFAVFQSTGTVVLELGHAIRVTLARPGITGAEERPLLALRAYLDATRALSTV